MQVNRQRKYLSRSYINEFMFGYDISPSFLLIGTAILLVGISFLQLQPIIAQVQPSEANLTSTEQQHLLDGISFQIDNVTFSHHTANVNGIQLQYVTGGHGDPVVLLHGWPEIMLLNERTASVMLDDSL